jgi:hypothetical protein
MAKKKHSPSRAGRKRARTTAKPTPRVTTRRVTPARSRASGRKRAAASRGLRPLSRPETVQVTLRLLDISGRLIRDPETFFTFRRVHDRRQIGDQVAMELTGSAVTFDLPVATGELAVCELDARRFRFAHSPVFSRTPGPPIVKEATLMREPREWTARFTRWADLSSPFDDLKRVLRASPGVTLFSKGENAEPLAASLAEESYDGMSGDAVMLAKAALLNVYYRLRGSREPITGERSWFSYVSSILAIGRERVIALVEPDMERLVRQIHASIDEFRADYERTPAENHRGNVPPGMQGRIDSMISIKSSHDKGNFQLTLTHLVDPHQVLLDVDIDENGALLAHTADLFKHKLSGGTHPHDIHELLVLQDGKLGGFDLGYRLA